MAITTLHKETKFGVGDVIRVHQRIYEPNSDKNRVQIFEGIVIAIRGKNTGKSVIVRRIGAQNVGMELIFPLEAPTIEKIEVSREGVKGTRHAKLYFIRNKSHKEIEKIYSRTHKKEIAPVVKKKAASKKTAKASVKSSK